MGETVLRVRVKPQARDNSLEQLPDGVWLAQVKAAPIDGRANDEVLALIARQFGRPKSAVSIKSGAGSRIKLVRVRLA